MLPPQQTARREADDRLAAAWHTSLKRRGSRWGGKWPSAFLPNRTARRESRGPFGSPPLCFLASARGRALYSLTARWLGRKAEGPSAAFHPCFSKEACGEGKKSPLFSFPAGQLGRKAEDPLSAFLCYLAKEKKKNRWEGKGLSVFLPSWVAKKGPWCPVGLLTKARKQWGAKGLSIFLSRWVTRKENRGFFGYRSACLLTKSRKRGERQRALGGAVLGSLCDLPSKRKAV